MFLTTSYFGDPARMSELMRVRAVYNSAPGSEQLTAHHCNEMHKSEVMKSARMSRDGWHNVRAYNRWIRFTLATKDDCEVIAILPEIRPGGLH